MPNPYLVLDVTKWQELHPNEQKRISEQVKDNKAHAEKYDEDDLEVYRSYPLTFTLISMFRCCLQNRTANYLQMLQETLHTFDSAHYKKVHPKLFWRQVRPCLPPDVAESVEAAAPCSSNGHLWLSPAKPEVFAENFIPILVDHVIAMGRQD